MAIGMGIHGESGIRNGKLETARLKVEKLTAPKEAGDEPV